MKISLNFLVLAISFLVLLPEINATEINSLTEVKLSDGLIVKVNELSAENKKIFYDYLNFMNQNIVFFVASQAKNMICTRNLSDLYTLAMKEKIKHPDIASIIDYHYEVIKTEICAHFQGYDLMKNIVDYNNFIILFNEPWFKRIRQQMGLSLRFFDRAYSKSL